ncbi:MAG TPA: multidrug ABC transporter permease [Methanoculleus sp.]|nr:multidrug ABC transporter permease [Methanoculleus sp.]
MNVGFATVYWRDMLRFFRFKTLLVSSLVQPALWMAFFGVAMSSNFDRLSARFTPGAGIEQIGYLTFMGAGVIAMTTLFTSLFGGVVILFDKNWGLMREIFASPLPRTHIVLGIGLSGVTKAWIQSIIIMVFGLILGVRFFSGYTGVETAIAVLGILAFVGTFALGFLFLSATIAVSMESPEGLQGIITLLTLPIFFTSNALYPTTAFPPFLQALAVANPLTHLINGIRYFAIGSSFSAIGIEFVYTPQIILASYLVLLGFCVGMFLLSRWAFNRAVVT